MIRLFINLYIINVLCSREMDDNCLLFQRSIESVYKAKVHVIQAQLTGRMYVHMYRSLALLTSIQYCVLTNQLTN